MEHRLTFRRWETRRVIHGSVDDDKAYCLVCEQDVTLEQLVRGDQCPGRKE